MSLEFSRNNLWLIRAMGRRSDEIPPSLALCLALYCTVHWNFLGRKAAEKISGLVSKVFCFDVYPDNEWIKERACAVSLPKNINLQIFIFAWFFCYYRTLFCIRLIAVVADLWVTPSFQLTVWLILWCFQLRLMDWSWLNEGCFAHWREFGWLVIMWQWLRTAFANLVEISNFTDNKSVIFWMG